ncbi:hypothetical protein GGI03_005176 [Coemansia sp. RSA 2337]|nr:hypothetical protein GGH13_007106 [Coemansia sp. S155-1]KAJ2421502.1 hypothetical protein GGF41_003844 [Coemansia sp. RSA 2531]KAJ2460871.1 hypothetical protein GGI03_005176 [Coemansia sp. RSA 2337]
MGCRKCRGWEESECCLSQHNSCACACHTSCDCAYCYTVELKARSTARATQTQTGPKSAASRISTVLRLESRPSTTLDSVSTDQVQVTTNDLKASKLRRWSRRNSTLKPLRLFA